MRLSVPHAPLHAVLVRAVMLAVILSLAVPLSAMATPLTNLDVTLLLQPQGSLQPLLLISGRLPEGTTLPAEIALPVPAGAEDGVMWTGEIFGGPVEDDPVSTPRFEVRDGVNVAVFTLTQSLIGQIEIEYPDGTAVVADDLRTGGFELSAFGAIGATRLAVAVPTGFQAASLPDGVLTSEIPDGTVYYYVELPEVAPGDPLAFQIEYRGAPLPPGGVPATQPQSGEVPPLLIVLIGAVLAGALLIVLASRSKHVESDEADESLAEVDFGPIPEGVEVTRAVKGVAPPAENDVEVPGSDTTPSTALTSFLSPKVLLIAIAVLVLALVVALNVAGGDGSQVGVTDTSGTVVSQRISTAAADGEVQYSLIISCACPPEVEALKMFDALRQVPGVAHAALDTTTLVMNIQYDPAQVQLDAIEDRLRAGGYLP